MGLKLVLLATLAAAFAQGQIRQYEETQPQVSTLPPFPTFPTESNTPSENDSSSSSPPLFNPLALLPLPNGPFYGFPFDARQTVGRYLPLTVAGTCEAQSVYNITRAEDLLGYKTDLECIYNLGTAPNKIPTGAFYAKPLTVLNSPIFNQLYSRLWSGFFVNETECNGMRKFIGFNNFAGRPLFPFDLSINKLNLNLAPGEYDDGRSSLLLDFTGDLLRSCPDYRSNLARNFGDAVIRRRNLNTQVFPMNQFVTALRFIGKQEDGGAIYLGKTYMKDPFRPDNQAVTVEFFYAVNYEPEIMKEFGIGDILPPIRKTFKYMFPGIIDVPFRLLPFDNLITTPIRTVQKMVRGVFNAGRNSLIYANEIASGFRNFGANNKRFQQAFKNDRVLRQRAPPTVRIQLGKK